MSGSFSLTFDNATSIEKGIVAITGFTLPIGIASFAYDASRDFLLIGTDAHPQYCSISFARNEYCLGGANISAHEVPVSGSFSYSAQGIGRAFGSAVSFSSAVPEPPHGRCSSLALARSVAPCGPSVARSLFGLPETVRGRRLATSPSASAVGRHDPDTQLLLSIG